MANTGTADPRAAAKATPITAEERKVIFASSLGTVFEWYDFYLYGSLAPIIAKQFFIGEPTPPSSSRCWRLPPASSCVRSARSCSAAWAT
jgi:MFS family permease